MNATQAYVLAKKYTDETAIQFGGLKGASCTIKSITHQNGRNIVIFEWKNNQGETRESEMIVNDGTPIYVWEAGNHYEYGDLAIYKSCFYRCIIANEDVEFDATKWNEIGSPDGNYDIIQNNSLLPPVFTSADRKMYYSIEDENFWLWNGSSWNEQEKLSQYRLMPTAAPAYLNKIVQYVGAPTQHYRMGFFYHCVYDSETETYSWEEMNTSDVEPLSQHQMTVLLGLIE